MANATVDARHHANYVDFAACNNFHDTSEAVVGDMATLPHTQIENMATPGDETSLTVEGPTRLSGRLEVGGSKNAFHKLLAACILIPGRHVLRRVPDSADASALMRMAASLGASIDWEPEIRRLTIDSIHVRPVSLPASDTLQSTGSFLFAGPLLARFGQAVLGPPGGDQIGARPVDRHLDAFASLGAQSSRRGSEFVIQTQRLTPGTVRFEKDTVNGTANAVMAAVGADGSATIIGPSTDPDVASLISFLRRAGVGVETYEDHLVVHGHRHVASCDVEFDVPRDRNDAATLVIAGALCGESLEVVGAEEIELTALVDALVLAGVPIGRRSSGLVVDRVEPSRSIGLHVESAPFPGFSTDWGPLIQVMMTQLSGESSFHERVHSRRFSHLGELAKMGASISQTAASVASEQYGFDDAAGRQLVRIWGPSGLRAATLCADNVRGAAGLLLAALIATGVTTMSGAEHLLRGYDALIPRLVEAGARIAWSEN